MDKATLVDADLQAGQQLVKRLGALDITVDVADWLQDDETGDWRLVLSSPDLKRPGAKRVYDAVVSILGHPYDSTLELDNVRVLGPGDGVVRDLKARVRTNTDLQDIKLDGLYLGDRTFRAARIYRVLDGHSGEEKFERGARVRVRATGQLGTVHGTMYIGYSQRYLVLYDVHVDETRPLGENPPPPSGKDYAANELDLLYVVRSGGWPEKNPDWLVAATTAPGAANTNVTFRRARH